MPWFWKLARFVVLAVLLVMTTLVVGGAFEARWRLPELKTWHRVVLDDVTAPEIDDRFGLPQYLAREARLFAQLQAFEAEIETADRTPVNRYVHGSLSHPMSAGRDWNRTFESEPAAPIRGGALLIHGLTDSPYSMRAIAERLREQGIYSLALRMPGHGTLPSGLVHANWADWLAAVRMGVRHVASRIPGGAPLAVVGYSNGGALALKYTLEAVEGNGRVPDKLILLSPMIGVTPTARLAWWVSLLGWVPYFEKANWLDVIPEYNPFKYNSFATNAAFQTASLTRVLQADLRRVAAGGRQDTMPPVLTFQSIVDATVSTPAVVHDLYDRLPANGSELVLFDVNHLSGIDVFVQPSDLSMVATLMVRTPRRYRRVIVTNGSSRTRDVDSETMEPGMTDVVRQPLGLAWPAEVFSLTHVALPFAVSDPLYGIEGPVEIAGLLPIGRLSPRGERAVLIVGTDTLMRLSSNPFFPFVAERIGRWLSIPPMPGSAPDRP